MANQVAARLSGDDYQHLYSWLLALELKMPGKEVSLVRIEDEDAGHVDDVTVEHAEGSVKPDRFYQIKYHVDIRSEYSTEALVAHKPNGTSLLQKLWRTWLGLKSRSPGRPVELILISNWVWDPSDKVKACISGKDTGVSSDFIAARPGSDIGKLRDRWQQHLGATDGQFSDFVSCLHFRLGWDCTDELEQRICERMEWLSLKCDTASLLIACGIIRGWVKSGTQKITQTDLDAALEEHNLFQPSSQERHVAVYLTTIEKQSYDLEPDYLIDWRKHFEGSLGPKGHQLIHPSDWNDKLLPELLALKERVNEDTNCRLVRARGLSRLSAWFAFGFTFSEVSRYTLEIDQAGKLWRTDAAASADLRIIVSSASGAPDGETMSHSESGTVAVGISITSSLEEEVRTYLAARTDTEALLFVRPDRELGSGCLQSASDAVSLATQTKEVIREFVRRRRATRLMLFYLGPAGGACFIGHRLNAVCKEIQVMEYVQPGYAPSFLLR